MVSAWRRSSSPRGHALLELYARLPSTAREAVCAHARQGSQRYGVAQPTDDGFRGFMTELDTAFVDWPYAFEKGTTGQIQIPQLIVVMMALHEACKQAGAN